jgi:hypothetical protein
MLGTMGIVLGPSVLVGLFYFSRSIPKLLPGLPFVMVSVALGAISTSLSASTRGRTGLSSEEMNSTLERASLVGNAAFQMAVLGIANISSIFPSHSKTRMLLDYLGMVLFFVLTLSLTSFADRENQSDGYIPVSFFGFSRSRRLIFAVYAGYCIMCPLGIGSIQFSVAAKGWRPVALQSAQACLLIECLMSLLCADLLRRRYRDRKTSSKRFRWSMNPSFLATVLLIGNAIMWTALHYSFYVYGLSAISVVCLSISVSFLWLSTFMKSETVDEVMN